MREDRSHAELSDAADYEVVQPHIGRGATSSVRLVRSKQNGCFSALHNLHSCDLVHRDVKLANTLFSDTCEATTEALGVEPTPWATARAKLGAGTG